MSRRFLALPRVHGSQEYSCPSVSSLPSPFLPTGMCAGIPYLNLQLLQSERQNLERNLRREQQQQQRRRSSGPGPPGNDMGGNSGNGTRGNLGSGTGANAERGPLELTDPVDRLFVGKQVERVRSWLNQTEPPSVDTVPLGGAEAWEGPVLELEECNSYRRAAIYQELEKEFGGAEFYAHSIRGQTSWASRIQLLRATEAQIAALEEARREQQRRELEEAGGFARVLELLLEACRTRSVPLVGHNMLLDLAYFSNQFLQPLPHSLHEFRSQASPSTTLRWPAQTFHLCPPTVALSGLALHQGQPCAAPLPCMVGVARCLVRHGRGSCAGSTHVGAACSGCLRHCLVCACMLGCLGCPAAQA